MSHHHHNHSRHSHSHKSLRTDWGRLSKTHVNRRTNPKIAINLMKKNMRRMIKSHRPKKLSKAWKELSPKLKKAIYVAVTAALVGAIALFFYQMQNTEKVQEEYNKIKLINEQITAEEKSVVERIALTYEALESDFNTYLPGIVCWGDSITAGSGGNGTTYPDVIASLIKENLVEQFDAQQMASELGKDGLTGLEQYSVDNVEVINMGVGGEDTNTILGRNGAVPFVVEDDLTIPADTSAVEIKIVSENGKNVAPLRQGTKGIESVSIAGIEGKLSIQQESYTSSDYTYFFTRDTSGESITVEAGTEIVTSGSTQYLDYIPVIFIGQNGGYSDIEELIEQQRAIINHQELGEANQGKFIIVGLHTGTADERGELEAAMEEEYGNRYINLREYMSVFGLHDAGIVATDEDKEMMAKGMTPKSLLSDNVHFTEVGYQLVGNLIYDRMDELGYFDEIKAALAEVVGTE